MTCFLIAWTHESTQKPWFSESDCGAGYRVVMASRLLQRMQVPTKALFRSSVLSNEGSLFNARVRCRTNVAFANPQRLGASQQPMCKSNSCLDWQNKSTSRWTRRQIGTTPVPPLEPEELPDPLNPHEHPLATVGYAELSEDKKFWRKRQAEAPKPVYVREVDENGYAFAVGKRKSSVARVWLREGTGSVEVNGKDWVDYFPRTDHREQNNATSTSYR